MVIMYIHVHRADLHVAQPNVPVKRHGNVHVLSARMSVVLLQKDYLIVWQCAVVLRLLWGWRGGCITWVDVQTIYKWDSVILL
jgi:hypothetical protein